MNIEYLRNFIKLTQYKSFSKLARDLPLSQSTLSHQISQLEKEFNGVILIDRTTKKFELTQAGNVLLKSAEQIIDLYDKCKVDLSKFQDQIIEAIIISASTIPGSHILPRYIAGFRNRNPTVKFKKTSGKVKVKDILKKIETNSQKEYIKKRFEDIKLNSLEPIKTKYDSAIKETDLQIGRLYSFLKNHMRLTMMIFLKIYLNLCISMHII